MILEYKIFIPVNLKIQTESRVPTQVLQSLIKSYIWFSICKALQSLIFRCFGQKGLIKSYFR